MTTPVPHHDPVMMQEVLETLDLKPGMVAVDGTLGLAGHALQMHLRIQPDGLLIGLDWDQDMLAIARTRLPEDAILVHANYRQIPTVLAEVLPQRNRPPLADAILLDLGFNSFQVDSAERGLSFLQEGPLDMRLDRSQGESASSYLNRASENEIERALRDGGGERWSRRIAKMIIERRRVKPLRTTQDLVDCVHAAIPVAMRDQRIHPATRTFQGIRVAVNRELEDLEECFVAAAQCLAPGGAMVVLSYHSGEDRPAKEAMRRLAQGGFIELTKKPLVPTAEEVATNRRSRSAKLRAIRRPLENKAHA